MPARAGFAFGPYQLRTDSCRLVRDGVDVPLPSRYFTLLHLLVSRAGDGVTRQSLLDVWDDVEATDNSLNQAISRLRAVLDPGNPTRYIETVARRGYRFIASVQPLEAADPDVDVEALLSPYRIFMDGRAALETLRREQIADARRAFERLVRLHPNDAGFRVGLATACALWAESTRADLEPDRAAMHEAEVHAREACRLSPDLATAWATLAFVLARTGRGADALAAHLRAQRLDPKNWSLLLRASYDTWGEDRVSAARRALALMPGLAIARWLVATVYAARRVFDEVECEVDAGCAELVRTAGKPAHYAAIGLHWMKALLYCRRGAYHDAIEACRAELALEVHGHLYGREMAANTWYLLGACHLLLGDRAAARAAFDQALARIPGHPLALAGLAILDDRDLALPAGDDASFDWAVAHACVHAWRGDVAIAVRLVTTALAAAPPGSTGWHLALEPLLRVDDAPESWADALETVRQRAM